MTIINKPPLYKRDSKGLVRIWSQDIEGSCYRTVSGLEGGTLVTSEWTQAEPKNVGRSNATTAEEQAAAEVEANYALKLRTGYFTDAFAIDQGSFTKPMLATDYDKVKAKIDPTDGVWSQPKLDGMRCIARADGLWTRTGKPINSVPHIEEALAPIFEEMPDLILDGELYNHELRDDFNGLMSILRKDKPNAEALQRSREIAQFHVYDIASDASWIDRKDQLPILFEIDSTPVQYVPTAYVNSQRALDELNERYIHEGYEGQIIRLNGQYENKRSKLLIKRKEFTTEEFPVILMDVGRGNWAGAIKQFVVQLPNGNTCEATPRGSYADLQKLHLDGRVPDWATVRHFGYTADGKLRFPIAVDYGFGKRED